MTIPKEQKYKRTLPNIKGRDVAEESLWALFWYGRSFWDKKANRIYKEVFLTNIPDSSYYLQSWDLNDVIKVEIPEEKTILFPLGSLFDTNGKLYKRPFSQKNNRVYSINDVEVHQTRDYFEKGLYSLLNKEKGLYPVVDSNFGMIYQNAPYYNILHKSSNNKVVEIIIPIQVVNAYFYYLSTACTYHIIYNTIYEAVKKPVKFNNIPIVYFDGSIIRYEDAKLLAKYFFVKNTDNNGMKIIKYFSNEFMVNVMEKGQDININYRGYFKSKIPFSNVTKLDVLGQFISEEEVQKFLVYRIINDDFIFNVDNFSMKNINDKRSKEVEKPQEIINYIGKNRIERINQIQGVDGVNKSLGIKNEIDNDLIETFNKTPKVKLLDKTFQDNIYIKSGNSFYQVDGLEDDFRNHNSEGTNARVNFSYDNIKNSFKVLEKALVELNETIGFKVEFLQLNSFDNKIYSFHPESVVRTKLLIVSIIYNNKNYCLIDAGINRIGVLKYINPSIGFLKHKDTTINNLLIYMENRYNWSSVKRHKEILRFNLEVLASMNHSIKFDFDKSVNILFNKIKDRIIKDI